MTASIRDDVSQRMAYVMQGVELHALCQKILRRMNLPPESKSGPAYMKAFAKDAVRFQLARHLNGAYNDAKHEWLSGRAADPPSGKQRA